MRSLAFTVCLFLFSLASTFAREPSPEEILAAARINPMGLVMTLEAQLRAGSVKVP